MVERLSKSRVYSVVRGIDHVFIVPGNHDIDITSADDAKRWGLFCGLMSSVYSRPYRPTSPLDLVELHDRPTDGYCVLTLNSVRHTQKGTDDENRGQMDEEQLKKVHDLLSKRATEIRHRIRIALIHHHPVLIPQLVETRGYDAVLRSGHLLNVLHKYGFHLILHGHKHWPCSFTSDARSAYDQAPVAPLLVVSGGSVGSTALPSGQDSNCYNRISVRWNAGTDEVRMRVETRGLTKRDDTGQELPRSLWRWDTLRVDDRSFYRGASAPLVHQDKIVRESHPLNDDEDESSRQKEYRRLRDNMLVAMTRPSFLPGQKYEVVFWVIEHKSKDLTRRREVPKSVTWSGGICFSRKTVLRDNDLRFAAFYNYYGPMLIRAEISFDDGRKETAFIYAPIPSAADFQQQGGLYAKEP